MNWGRGLFRFWLVSFAFWCLACAIFGGVELSKELAIERKLLDGPIVTNAKLLNPQEFQLRVNDSSNADGNILVDVEGSHILVSKDLETLTPLQQKRAMQTIIDRLHIYALDSWFGAEPILSEVATIAPWALGLPALVLVLGYLIGWALMGFKK